MPTQTQSERMVFLHEFTNAHLGRDNLPLGKTALQKLTYFLQEVHGIDCGYDFTLHTYGPYSSQLDSDLDTARALNLVSVEYDRKCSRYEIRPGATSPRGTVSGEASDAISRVLNDFSSCTAKDLELRATTVFAERELRYEQVHVIDADIIDVVHELKPQFDKRHISMTLEELKVKGYVAGVDTGSEKTSEDQIMSGA